MPYASAEDLAIAFPDDAVITSASEDSVTLALSQASERIDSVMGSHGVQLPLDSALGGLSRAVLDIARWYLWQGYGFEVVTADGTTHQVRVRYLDAISWAGDAAKSLAYSQAGQTGTLAPRASVRARAQVFSDETLARLF